MVNDPHSTLTQEMQIPMEEDDEEEEKPIRPQPPRAKSSFFRNTPWYTVTIIYFFNPHTGPPLLFAELEKFVRPLFFGSFYIADTACSMLAKT